MKANLIGNGFTSGYLTQKASSIAHYLDAAVELKLLVKQGSMFSLTNRARFLMDGIRPQSASPYPLDPQTKVFLLHVLLGVDYFGLAAVVTSLLRGKGKLIQIQREHQSQLLRVLEATTRGSSDSRLHRLAQDRIIGIRNWKQPDSYSEHLVSAKLNWLVDLGIAKCAARSSSEFILDEKHEEWLRCFCQTIVPTEADITAHTLNYAKMIVPESTREHESNTCSILGYAFSRLAHAGPLVKLRSVDVVLCFLCFFAPFLLRRIRSAVPLFPQVTILCGPKIYKLTIASRSTQSFVVCSKGEDQ
ncbi:MAG TPA: hypothetical protein VK581_00175 [Chthoniobacterales bacterium]|nr:hypothetical protein [Chthoniobacterales bacterium]